MAQAGQHARNPPKQLENISGTTHELFENQV